MGAGTPSVQHIHASQASRIALGTQQELNRHLLNKDLNDDPSSEFACRGGQSGHSLCYVQPPLALPGSQDLEPLTLSHPSRWKALAKTATTVPRQPGFVRRTLTTVEQQ